jgi:hypothetical protein
LRVKGEAFPTALVFPSVQSQSEKMSEEEKENEYEGQ